MSTTQRAMQNFQYRLKHKQTTAKQTAILEALDFWKDHYPELASCQDIATLAGCNQSYVQLLIRILEKEGYLKLHRHRNGKLKVPGIFIIKGYKASS